MGASIQPRQRQQNYVLQRSQKLPAFHLFCNVEEMDSESQVGNATSSRARCNETASDYLLDLTSDS